MRRGSVVLFGACAWSAAVGVSSGCSSSHRASAATAGAEADAAGPRGDPVDVPIDGVTRDEVTLFYEGDELFDLQLRPYDGLGPLYTQTSCGACHDRAARGPGLVQKMAIVEPDGFTPSRDQSKLAFGNTVHPLLAAGAKTPILPPRDCPTLKVTIRVGPPVLGRGYIEAIDDAAIERVAREQAARGDAIHGRVNRVTYDSEPNPDQRFNAHRRGDPVIGRFGVKARIATLDEFVADAMQGDMGITSPLRPTEIKNPDGLTDDLKPGIDVTIESVNKRAMYLRTIAIPRRDGLTDEGRAAFDRALCSGCHVPSLPTRADYPIPLLAGIDAPVYTDVLLHDMGGALADGTVGSDGLATSREWRTAPLVGIRFFRTFLHDGRATTLDEAIVDHDGPGSEATESVRAYQALSNDERRALLDFVGAL